MEMNNFYYQVDRLFEEKKLNEAEEFMKETLAQAEAESDAGAVITVCNELGGYYRAVSRYSDGIPLYEKALKLMRDMGLARSEHYGTTLVNYATTYTMAGDTIKALNLYTEAAEIYAEAGLGLQAGNALQQHELLMPGFRRLPTGSGISGKISFYFEGA